MEFPLNDIWMKATERYFSDSSNVCLAVRGDFNFWFFLWNPPVRGEVKKKIRQNRRLVFMPSIERRSREFHVVVVLAPVVQTLDGAIHQINYYPAGKYYREINYAIRWIRFIRWIAPSNVWTTGVGSVQKVCCTCKAVVLFIKPNNNYAGWRSQPASKIR